VKIKENEADKNPVMFMDLHKIVNPMESNDAIKED
jgi:hypothetical protein